MTFWYYMWSSEFYSEMEFSVNLAYVENPEAESENLFNRRGWMKPKWTVAHIDVVTIGKWQLFFEGKGKNANGTFITVAFDDFDYNPGFCPRPGVCDFEFQNACGWSNAEDDDICLLYTSPSPRDS